MTEISGPTKEPAADAFVTIGRVYGLPEAAIVIGKLRAAGILVHTSDHRTASVASHWMHALGGIDLQVPARQAVDAALVAQDCEPHAARRRGLVVRLAMILGFLLFSVPPPASGLFIRGSARTTSGQSKG